MEFVLIKAEFNSVAMTTSKVRKCELKGIFADGSRNKVVAMVTNTVDSS